MMFDRWLKVLMERVVFLILKMRYGKKLLLYQSRLGLPCGNVWAIQRGILCDGVGIFTNWFRMKGFSQICSELGVAPEKSGEVVIKLKW